MGNADDLVLTPHDWNTEPHGHIQPLIPLGTALRSALNFLNRTIAAQKAETVAPMSPKE